MFTYPTPLQDEVVQITINKYRKAQQQLDEVEHRAETAERNITVHVTRHHASGGHGHGARARSMSTSRESTRIIRA